MGSNVAPPYANAYMSVFEDSYIYTNDLYQRHSIAWHRYIDDIFCLWAGDTQSLSNFVNQ